MSKPVALVTGAGSGIGLCAAKALARQGFVVVLNDRKDSEALRLAVEGIRSDGGAASMAPFDVGEIAELAPRIAQVEAETGPLTTLVNNAGVGVLRRDDPLEVSEESWDRCLRVNAKAMFFLCQAFSRLLLSRSRPANCFHAIVNVTSANAEAVALQRAEYCASKAAAAMVSKVFATRLGTEGIAVYDVRPGLIDTAMTAPVIDEYRTRARNGLTLFRRVGTAAEVGNVIANLASGCLPYTTGQVIAVDAGMLVPRF